MLELNRARLLCPTSYKNVKELCENQSKSDARTIFEWYHLHELRDDTVSHIPKIASLDASGKIL